MRLNEATLSGASGGAIAVLDAVRGNRSRAAAILGIDRKTLQRKLERFAAEPRS